MTYENFPQIVSDESVESNENKIPTLSNSYISMEDQEVENEDPTNITKVPDAIKEEMPVLRKILNEISEKNTDGGKKQKQEVTSKDQEIQLLQDLENLHIIKKSNKSKTSKQVEIFEGIAIGKSDSKQHNMTTRLDSKIRTPILCLRNRSVRKSNAKTDPGLHSRSSADKKTMTVSINTGKSDATKRKGSPLTSEKKYMSLAERVHRFHNETPDRFRTIPKNKVVHQSVKPKQTLPKTPLLTSKNRRRPINFPNSKQREELELAEMRKHQIKAYPLNERILREPLLTLKFPIEKKPTTVPEPFRLTEMKKKDLPQTPVFVFKAQPVRTSILHGPTGVPPKKVTKATVPLTPKIKIPERFATENMSSRGKTFGSEYTNQSNQPRTTKVQPFSFDNKIKEILLKKEENIKKIIEEEKKNFNSFKAHPLPPFFGRGLSSHNDSVGRTDIQTNKLNVTFSAKKESENKKSDTALFRAKPASVVHQKPFIPVLSKHELVLPGDFHLNTEKRAQERQKFDEKMKQKQEAVAGMLQKLKEEAELNEKMKKLEERKLTEFKAKPMPKYKPFEIMPADPSCLTLPQTPRCLSSKESKLKSTDN